MWGTRDTAHFCFVLFEIVFFFLPRFLFVFVNLFFCFSGGLDRQDKTDRKKDKPTLSRPKEGLCPTCKREAYVPPEVNGAP